jgi:hypothetical protein
MQKFTHKRFLIVRLAKSVSLVIAIVGLLNQRVYSQENCEQSLKQATDEFEAGRFYSLPTLLKDCLDRGFTKEQRFRAYYLLTQSYLVLDNQISAEDSYLKLLRINPEFIPNEKDDPIDLVYLSRKFTSRPRFTPHYKFGANVSFPRSIYEVSTFSSPSTTTENSLRIAFQVGAGLDWNIHDNWSLGLEAVLSNRSFSSTSTRIAMDDNLEVIEYGTYADIPLYLKYSHGSGKWRPFLYAGYAVNLLLSSTASLVFNDFTDGRNLPAQGPDESLIYHRKFLNQSLVSGGGVKCKIGKDYLYIDARYMIGLNNVTIPERSYYNADGSLATTITTYQSVSDLFRLDNLALSVGYVRPLYDPRKLKPLNTKGFFKRLFKSKSKDS